MTIDASTIVALAEGDPRARAHLEVFRRHDVEVVVPAAAIVQTLEGRRLHDARVNVVISGCRVAELTEPIARRAAVLRQKAGKPDATVDAMVVATSELVGGGALLTSRASACTTLAVLASVQLEGA